MYEHEIFISAQDEHPNCIVSSVLIMTVICLCRKKQCLMGDPRCNVARDKRSY